MEVDNSDSLVSGLGEEEKESKEVTHVPTSLMMAMIDLTQYQFLDMMDKAPSPMMVSSPARVNSKGAISSDPDFASQ